MTGHAADACVALPSAVHAGGLPDRRGRTAWAASRRRSSHGQRRARAQPDGRHDQRYPRPAHLGHLGVGRDRPRGCACGWRRGQWPAARDRSHARRARRARRPHRPRRRRLLGALLLRPRAPLDEPPPSTSTPPATAPSPASWPIARRSRTARPTTCPTSGTRPSATRGATTISRSRGSIRAAGRSLQTRDPAITSRFSKTMRDLVRGATGLPRLPRCPEARPGVHGPDRSRVLPRRSWNDWPSCARVRTRPPRSSLRIPTAWEVVCCARCSRCRNRTSRPGQALAAVRRSLADDAAGAKREGHLRERTVCAGRHSPEAREGHPQLGLLHVMQIGHIEKIAGAAPGWSPQGPRCRVRGVPARRGHLHAGPVPRRQPPHHGGPWIRGDHPRRHDGGGGDRP